MRKLARCGTWGVLLLVTMVPALSLADCPQGQVEVRVTGGDGAPRKFVTVEFLGGPRPVSLLTGSGGSVCAGLDQKRRYTVRVRERDNVQSFPNIAVGQSLELKVKWW